MLSVPGKPPPLTSELPGIWALGLGTMPGPRCQQPGISPWGLLPQSRGSVQSTANRARSCTQGSGTVSQNPTLTPIPKCLPHTKWPSPGPRLAGMGESARMLRAVHATAQAAHAHAATPAQTPRTEHPHAHAFRRRCWPCPRSQEAPELWARETNSPGDGGLHPPGDPLATEGVQSPEVTGVHLPFQPAAAERGRAALSGLGGWGKAGPGWAQAPRGTTVHQPQPRAKGGKKG